MDRSRTIYVVTAIFLALTWVTLLARCWVRIKIVKSFGLDDKWMVLAQVFHTIFATVTIIGALYGNGKHMADLSPSNVKIALKYWWFGELTYTSSTCMVKIAICLFLLRVLVDRIHKWIIYAVGTVGTTYSAFFFLLMLLQCHPMSHYWDPEQPGRCISPRVIINATYGYSAACMATDFTLGILPIFIVRKLNMSRRTKLAAAGILALASVASLATIIRFPYIQNFSKTADYLYESYGITLWSNIEPGAGIVAGNLATLRPLFRNFHPHTKVLQWPRKFQQFPADCITSIPSLRLARGASGHQRIEERPDIHDIHLTKLSYAGTATEP